MQILYNSLLLYLSGYRGIVVKDYQDKENAIKFMRKKTTAA